MRLNSRSRLLVLVLIAVLCAIGCLQIASAQHGPLGMKPDFIEKPEGTFLSITETVDGEPAIRVDYPWTKHAVPSIEIRELLEENDLPEIEIRPLQFRWWAMWEETKVQIHQATDDAQQYPQEKRITGYFPRVFKPNADEDEDEAKRAQAREIGEKISQLKTSLASMRKIPFDLFSQRNSLGRRAAMLANEMKDSDREAAAPTVRRAVFPIIEDWSADETLLQLDLPRRHFDKPMKLRVWFMRHGKVVWTETIDWPGMKPENYDLGR